jgi:peptidoglycan/LPS O-acetylase OafA/YrhL
LRKNLGHIREFDGMRAIAAFWVFLVHISIGPTLATGAAEHSGLSFGWKAFLWLCAGGSYGVDIFFVLSGFLITGLLIADRESSNYFHNFYWRRVLRIQPVYLLSLLLTWFLMPGSHGSILLALLFIVNFSDRFHLPDIGPPWTLAIEEQFYLVWPLVVRRVSVRTLYSVSLATMLGSFGFRTIFFLITGHTNIRFTWNQLDGLAFGALLACQWIAPEEQPAYLRPWLDAINSSVARWVGCVLAAILVSPVTLPSRLCYPAIIVVNFMAYRFIRFVLMHPSSWRLAWLRYRPLRFFGDISYAFYMFHGAVMTLWDNHIGIPKLHFLPFFSRFLCVFTITVLVCLLVRHLIELPTQRLRRFVLRPSKPVDVPVG